VFADWESEIRTQRCANNDILRIDFRGFGPRAARRVAADNREGLEQLCGYVTRPPLAAGLLEKVADDEYLSWVHVFGRPRVNGKNNPVKGC
jgi:hypothetical protein